MNLFYESTKENCLCGENKIESANYRTDIPCRHRLSLGTQFPDLQIPDLEISLYYNDLIIDYQIDDSKDITEKENTVYDEKKYVLKQIKFFSGSKKDNEIIKYIASNYKPSSERDGFYIRSKDVFLIQLIENGILQFKQ